MFNSSYPACGLAAGTPRRKNRSDGRPRALTGEACRLPPRSCPMKPFEGMRVIDATHVIAGPYGTYLLATLGAEVIKIEPPADPDQTRMQGSDVDLKRGQMGTWYLSQSANKRPVTLDLKQAAGVEVMKRLIAGADVLVENYRPGAFAALGFDDTTVRSLNPRIVHCSMSAFGQSGPRATQTGYDMVIQAASGLMAMTGTEAVNPMK